MKQIIIHNEEKMLALGSQFGGLLTSPSIIYLQGPLGAGKTTFVRGLLRGLGHAGLVKSPTYTLVEAYDLNNVAYYHFDLYRLHDPEELEAMGIRDYLGQNSICLIEWPDKGQGCLPTPDIVVGIEPLADLPEARDIYIRANTPAAQQLLTALKT